MTGPAPVPVFGPPTDVPLAAVGDVIASGWWGYGPRCRELERRFTDTWGGWALATCSGTEALSLAGHALKRRTNRRTVLVPAITFCATALAFIDCGLNVRAVDVDEQTLLIDVEAAERSLDSDTAAVVAVDLYGRPAPVRELRALCDRRGVALIEDRAHRIGLAAPPLGDFACTSFNAVKEAPCGEGGLVWGAHMDDEAPVRRRSYLGMDADTMARTSTTVHSDYAFSAHVGTKSRLSDVQAALVLQAIDSLAEGTERRAEIISRYASALGDAPVRLMERGGNSDSQLMAVVTMEANMRDAWRSRMASNGIATSVHYPSLSLHPLLDTPIGACPVAEREARRIATVPCFRAMSDEQVARVCEAMRECSREY